MAKLKDVIYLSNTDYDTLVSTGTVTIGSDVLTYDENNLYVTPDKVATTTEDGLMSSADKVKLDGLVDTGATSVRMTGSGNVVSTATYSANLRMITLTKGVTAITAHQSMKTLNTTTLAPQTASASESLTGSGTVNLHRIAKTGSYNDLNHTPWYFGGADNDFVATDGYAAIFDDLGDPSGNRPSSNFGEDSLDLYIYSTGFAVYDEKDSAVYKYSFPSHSGTIATEDQLGLQLIDLRMVPIT